jgi:hypothetical protein
VQTGQIVSHHEYGLAEGLLERPYKGVEFGRRDRIKARCGLI